MNQSAKDVLINKAIFLFNDGQLKMLECPVSASVRKLRDADDAYARTTGMNNNLLGYNHRDVSNPSHKILYGDGFSHLNGAGLVWYSNAINDLIVC